MYIFFFFFVWGGGGGGGGGGVECIYLCTQFKDLCIWTV